MVEIEIEKSFNTYSFRVVVYETKEGYPVAKFKHEKDAELFKKQLEEYYLGV